MQFQFDPRLFLKAMAQNIAQSGDMSATQMPMSQTPQIGQTINQDIGANIPGIKPRNSFMDALRDAIGKFDRQPQAINNQIRRPSVY